MLRKYKLIIFVVIMLIAILGVKQISYSNQEIFASEGPNPLVKFTVNKLNESGKITMPGNTAYWDAKPDIDEDGIVCSKDKDGNKYYNISSIAFQAMGYSSETPEFDMEKLTKSKTELTDSQLKAFEWFEKKCVTLNNGSYTWYYNFPLNYNNMLITSPWPSAFSQAAIIHSYITAWHITKEQKWIDNAIKASYAFEISADQGGLTSNIDGLSFYEEVPLSHGYSPHVLNAHLYATAILNQLGEITNDKRVKKLASDGIETAKALIPLYDQGYWTRYDLSPRLIDIPMKISLNKNTDSVTISKITMISPNKDESVLDLKVLSKNKSGNVFYGTGWSKTSKGNLLNGGEAFVQMYLPGGIPSKYNNSPGYTLEVEYYGDVEKPPVLSILGFREKIDEHYKIQLLGVSNNNDIHVAKYRIELKDLQWSTLQRYYMEWHTKAVQELWRQTKDPYFLITTIRWKNYLEEFDFDLKEQVNQITNSPVKERIFTGESSSYLDNELVNALNGLKDDQFNQRSIALALLRYVYFRMELGPNSKNTPEEILADGSGSCLHFSKAYQALASRAGLSSRIWNLYEIPVIGGHNLDEVKINGEWTAIDPAYGAFFTEKDNWNSKMVSVQELLNKKGENVTYWELKEMDLLTRGKVPPYASGNLEDYFNSTLQYPNDPFYDPRVVFSTTKAGIQGSEMEYIAEWTFDINENQNDLMLGQPTWTGRDGMWNGLLGLIQNGVKVSLHELGETSLQNVKQKYHLKGLVPGKVYTLETGVSYVSNPNVAIKAILDTDTEVQFISSEFQTGYASQPQLFVLYFKAKKINQDIELSIEGDRGYVLLNYIKVNSTEFVEVPKEYSINSEVVDRTSYYDGFEPENALDGIVDNNYVAARENEFPNNFIIDVGQEISPTFLRLVWNSENEYGKSFTLIGITDKNEERKILEVSENKLSGRSNQYLLVSKERYKRYKFEVYDAAGQPRMLLLDFGLYGAR